VRDKIMTTKKERKNKQSKAEKDLVLFKPIRKNGTMVKEVFDIATKEISEGKKPNMVKIHEDVGYSESSSRALKAMQSATWKQLKETVPKNMIMAQWCEYAFNNEDKRTSVAALENLGKILGLYEASKLKIETFSEKTDEFLEEVE